MAVYKVPQNVEAEDKLIGPFTFKQFIFLIAAAISGFLTWTLAQLALPLALITLPFTLAFGLLGVYHRDDQPVEVYLLSLMRFYFKPRVRLWSQTGMVSLVKVTAPKVIEKNYTDGLSQGEVRNRLKSLATVMDTRGWSSRNATLQDGQTQTVDASDRLVVPNYGTSEPTDVHQSDDPLYEYGSQYEKFSTGIDQASARIKEEAVERMHQQLAQPVTPPPAPAAAMPPVTPPLADPQPASPQPTVSYNPYPNSMHQRVINPAGSGQSAPTTTASKSTSNTSTMTEASSPDILRLARNNDRNVASIQREADNELHDDQTISLH